MLCVWSVKGKDNKELRSLETGSLRSSFEPLVTSSKPSVDYLQSLSLECMVKHFSFSLVLVLPINVAVVCLDKFFFVNPFADNTFDGFYKIYGPLETVTPRQSHYGLREIVDRRDL